MCGLLSASLPNTPATANCCYKAATTYNTAQNGMKTTQDGLAFGAFTIKETFIRKSFHKSNAQVQNPVIQNLIFSRGPCSMSTKTAKAYVHHGVTQIG
jgi:hypothetical protein